MRRTLAVGILACFLLSIIPAISDSPTIVERNGEEIRDSRLIDDSELTLGQIEALNAAGLARELTLIGLQQAVLRVMTRFMK